MLALMISKLNSLQNHWLSLLLSSQCFKNIVRVDLIIMGIVEFCYAAEKQLIILEVYEFLIIYPFIVNGKMSCLVEVCTNNPSNVW